jgi:hypothetical protein
VLAAVEESELADSAADFQNHVLVFVEDDQPLRVLRDDERALGAVRPERQVRVVGHVRGQQRGGPEDGVRLLDRRLERLLDLFARFALHLPKVNVLGPGGPLADLLDDELLHDVAPASGGEAPPTVRDRARTEKETRGRTLDREV